MYTVTLDDVLIHDPVLGDNTKILMDGVVTKKANCADSFSFKFYSSNVGFDNLHLMTSKIKVYKNSTCIFSGRPYSKKTDFYNACTVLCEGDLAILNDSIVRPYSFSGTVSDYLQMLINQHNSQVEQKNRFVLGSVTVSDTIVRYTSNYKNTWEELSEKTIDSDLGGYLYINPAYGKVLNYLSDSPYESNQVLKIGENILDYSDELTPGTYASALIPLGKEDDVTGERLTISSVNDGLDYVIDSVAVGRRGLVYRTEIFDDTTSAQILMARGRAALSKLKWFNRHIQMTALDLSIFNGNVDDIGFFEYVTTDDDVHNNHRRYLVTERKYNISAPEKDVIAFSLDDIDPGY